MAERYWEGWIPECQASCCKAPEPCPVCKGYGDIWVAGIQTPVTCGHCNGTGRLASDDQERNAI